MSSITFKAILDGGHFDPKKGSVKIQLIGASHISLDDVTTLAPNEEPIQVTLKSAQTQLKNYEVQLQGPLGVEDPTTLGEKEAERLKEAAGKLRTVQPFKATSESPKEFEDEYEEDLKKGQKR